MMIHGYSLSTTERVSSSISNIKNILSFNVVNVFMQAFLSFIAFDMFLNIPMFVSQSSFITDIGYTIFTIEDGGILLFLLRISVMFSIALRWRRGYLERKCESKSYNPVSTAVSVSSSSLKLDSSTFPTSLFTLALFSIISVRFVIFFFFTFIMSSSI